MARSVRMRLAFYCAVALSILLFVLRAGIFKGDNTYYTSSVRATRILKHAPGWTIFENVYMANGTLFIVTDAARASFPQLQMMIAKDVGADGNYFRREPTEDTLSFVTPAQARERWSRGVWTLKGTTVRRAALSCSALSRAQFLFNDPAKTCQCRPLVRRRTDASSQSYLISSTPVRKAYLARGLSTWARTTLTFAMHALPASRPSSEPSFLT